MYIYRSILYSTAYYILYDILYIILCIIYYVFYSAYYIIYYIFFIRTYIIVYYVIVYILGGAPRQPSFGVAELMPAPCGLPGSEPRWGFDEQLGQSHPGFPYIYMHIYIYDTYIERCTYKDVCIYICMYL